MGYAHRVESGQRVNLAEFDPPEDAGLKRQEPGSLAERPLTGPMSTC